MRIASAADVKHALLVIFHFVLIGPAVGYLVVVLELFLHAFFDAVIGMRPGEILGSIVTLMTLLLVPIGIIAGYWLGLVPAFVTGVLVCAIQIAGLPMSWSWTGIIALMGALVGYLLHPDLPTSWILFSLVVPSFVATATCCHLLRRWDMIFWMPSDELKG
jgi:hypothetical protein